MKRLLLLLLLFPSAWAWTGIAGNCAEGDFNGTLIGVLSEAGRQEIAHITICDEWELPWSESIDAYEISMSGGTIRSEVPRYLKLKAERVVISDVNLENVYLIVMGGDVEIKSVNIDVENDYCLRIIADRADINGLFVTRCATGVEGEVNDLTLAGFKVSNVERATDLENIGRINLFPVKETVTVERVVEINRPCPTVGETCDVYPYVQRIRELERANERLTSKLLSCENNVGACIAELQDMHEKMESMNVVPDISWLAALSAICLGVGYLLGRT